MGGGGRLWHIFFLKKIVAKFSLWGRGIDLMHWRHVSITTTPCWGSRLVALCARVVLEERWRSQPLSQCAGPGRPGGMACRGWPAGFMLGNGTRDSASFDPQHAGAPFCDVICIRSIIIIKYITYLWVHNQKNKKIMGEGQLPPYLPPPPHLHYPSWSEIFTRCMFHTSVLQCITYMP